jgi:hypothetical protein
MGHQTSGHAESDFEPETSGIDQTLLDIDPPQDDEQATALLITDGMIITDHSRRKASPRWLCETISIVGGSVM